MAKAKMMKMKLWQKILLGLTFGIITGVTAPEFASGLEPFGKLFISLIKMLIVPLIFFSIISGVSSLSDPNAMGRLGLKAVGLYVLLTMAAISLGLGVGHLVEPGVGVNDDLKKIVSDFQSEQPIKGDEDVKVKAEFSLADTLLGIVPQNPIQGMAEGNVLQIIFFAVMVGISASLVGKTADPFLKWNEAMAEIMYKMTAIVMQFAPYGVFALMAWVTSEFGIETMKSLAKVIVAVYIGCLLQIYLVYGVILKFVLRLSPLKFFKKVLDAQAVAFTTSSSSATLPVTIRTAREKLGVSAGTANFSLPLGATVNMNGTAIYHGVCVMFVAQIIGVNLDMGQYITVIMTSTLIAIGVAGIPGGGLVTLAVVLEAVDLPGEIAVLLIGGIDRILDMARTTVNVTGDAFVSLLVDKSEKKFDKDIYNK